MMGMAARGVVTPMPDFAVFADTQAEPDSVYEWLDWLEKQLPYPVVRVTYGDLAEDALQIKLSGRSGRLYMKALIPLFTLGEDGKKGILHRKCTRDYKVAIIQREIAKRTGKQPTSQWLGISIDEAQRMRDSQIPFITNRYPLIDMNLSRQDCIKWMKEFGYPEPPRSACVFCPYHSDKEWLRLKNEEPHEFQKALDWEKRRRMLKTDVCKSLAEAVVKRGGKPSRQVTLAVDDPTPLLELEQP